MTDLSSVIALENWSSPPLSVFALPPWHGLIGLCSFDVFDGESARTIPKEKQIDEKDMTLYERKTERTKFYPSDTY